MTDPKTQRHDRLETQGEPGPELDDKLTDVVLTDDAAAEVVGGDAAATYSATSNVMKSRNDASTAAIQNLK